MLTPKKWIMPHFATREEEFGIGEKFSGSFSFFSLLIISFLSPARNWNPLIFLEGEETLEGGGNRIFEQLIRSSFPRKFSATWNSKCSDASNVGDSLGSSPFTSLWVATTLPSRHRHSRPLLVFRPNGFFLPFLLPFEVVSHYPIMLTDHHSLQGNFWVFATFFGRFVTGKITSGAQSKIGHWLLHLIKVSPDSRSGQTDSQFSPIPPRSTGLLSTLPILYSVRAPATPKEESAGEQKSILGQRKKEGYFLWSFFSLKFTCMMCGGSCGLVSSRLVGSQKKCTSYKTLDLTNLGSGLLLPGSITIRESKQTRDEKKHLVFPPTRIWTHTCFVVRTYRQKTFHLAK